jgi:hypothetical protein
MNLPTLYGRRRKPGILKLDLVVSIPTLAILLSIDERREPPRRTAFIREVLTMFVSIRPTVARCRNCGEAVYLFETFTCYNCGELYDYEKSSDIIPEGGSVYGNRHEKIGDLLRPA